MAFSRLRPLALSWSIVGLLLVGGVTTANVHAQDPSTGDVASRVDSLFARWDKSSSPGCSLGISQDGAVVYERGYGMANLEYGLAITPQSVFNAESITKQFTAMAILLLAQRGQLSLDDEARTYITELPDYGGPLTIRHLLTHTSGLRDVWQLHMLAEPRDWTSEDDLRLLGRQQALNSPPGTAFEYLNFGYSVLGLIVERVSGQSLRTFADANIFRPLGMTHTFYHDNPRMVVPNRAAGYQPAGAGTFQVAKPFWYGAGKIGGHGGLHTTAGDLLIWEQNFADVRVGTPELVAAMQTKWYPPGSDTNFYGFGVYEGQYRGLRRVWHDGSGAGYQAYVIRYPDHGLAIAILCNVTPVNRAQIASRIADIYLAKSFPAPAASIPTVAPPAEPVVVTQTELAALAGTYWNPLTDRVLQIVFQDGQLTGDDELLTPLGGGRFRLGGRPNALLFPPQKAGASQEMHVLAPGETIVFSRMAVPSYSSIDLRPFVGKYVSTEIETTYTLTAPDSDLVIQIRGRENIVMRPVFADAFKGEGLQGEIQLFVKFMRDAQGVVTGFTLSETRARGVRFVRVE